MLNQKNELEVSSSLLYPLMQESPELRWAFIRKVYSILTIQLLLTVAVAATVVTVHPIALFFSTTWTGLAVYIVIIFVSIIVLFPLYYYCHQKHPLNFFLLGIFTVGFGFGVGSVCAFTSAQREGDSRDSHRNNSGGYQFHNIHILGSKKRPRICWAAKKGQEFAFLVPFLLSLLLVLLLFTLFQIFYPMGKISEMINGGLASIIFCAYIIYDTDTLIKRNSYDEYIWASISLYLDVLNLFLRLLSVSRAANS